MASVIYHVAGADNDWPPKAFLRHWAERIGPAFRTINTHQLAEVSSLPRGTYLFTDLERQDEGRRRLQAQIWDQLAEHAPQVRLLNHPLRAMGRRELLDALYADGINPYRAFRPNDLPDDLQFPVFVRMERDHLGSRTPLIESWADLEDTLSRAILQGTPTDGMIVVEFCDTSDAEGIFRKYSAFRIGDAIVPRHQIFSTNWMLKNIDLIDDAKREEEDAYLEKNPHESQIRQVFERASIEYGRMDYAVIDDRIVVWEINTNPIIMLEPKEYHPDHVAAQRWFRGRIEAALEAIDTPVEKGAPPIPVRLDIRALRCSP